MKKTIIASAILAAVVATPAAAQENNFSGFTATVLGGLDVIKVKDVTTNDSESKSGFAYGGALGYDYNAGSVVLGAEAELNGSTAKYVVQSGTDVYRLKAGRDIYVGARIGAPVTQNVLLYVKAGYTNARFKESLTSGGVTLSESGNLDGYRVGAGAEVAYDKLFGRLEYRYSDYGRQDNSDLSVKRHQVVVGVGYRF